MSEVKQGFYDLKPENVLDAIEQLGFFTTGEFTQLNSYENRVFDVALENQDGAARSRVIAKFYRPQRWSREAIQAEHDFLWELKHQDIGVVPPMKIHEQTLFEYKNMYVGLFPKFRGRMPDELNDSDFAQIGRILARVHNIGAQSKARARPNMDTSYYGGWDTLDFLQDWIADEVRDRYNDAASFLLEEVDDLFDPSEFIRIHGDCHRGNLLHDGSMYNLVDFDDFCNGPAVQDLWMLLPGDQSETLAQQEVFIKAYSELREFPMHQLQWIPLLRALRIMGYAGWIAKRWDDPSFSIIFPNFNSYRYWAEECEAIEKIAWSIRQD